MSPSRPIPRAITRRIRRRLLAWFGRHRRDLPWRKTSDPYAVFLSEIMLQQTQVATVIPYYRRFLERFPTLSVLAAARLDTVLKLWSGLGYYQRARNLHRAARIIISERAGRIPKSPEQLARLPGVGRYTAGGIASIAFDVRAPAVDGNVSRVLARLFDLPFDVRKGPGAHRVRDLATELLPRRRCGDFNQALMELGATVCLPGKAVRCEQCPICDTCLANAAGNAAVRPVKGKAVRPARQRRVVAAITHRDRWLFVRRPPHGLWGGLWEMPSAEVNGSTARSAVVQLVRNYADPELITSFRPIARTRHVLTHRLIDLEIYRCAIPARSLRRERIAGQRWLPLTDAGSLPLSAMMRRVIHQLDSSGSRSSPRSEPRP